MNNHLYKAVSQILVEHDPLGLIGGGAPMDEYSTEAVIIARFISNDNKSQLRDYIKLLFVERFEVVIDDKIVDKLASSLVERAE